MINFQNTPFSYACANCGKLTMTPFIDIHTEITTSNAKINLCSACQYKLAQKILFRKDKASAIDA